MDSEDLRSFDTRVLVVLRGGEELKQEGVEGPIVSVALVCGEVVNKRELFCDGFGPRHVYIPSD